MATLTQLAFSRLSAAEIWEQGLLNLPLQSSLRQQIEDRLTFDNLYREGFINEDIDLDLLAYAMEKSVPYLLWAYISYNQGTNIFSDTRSPFTQEGEEYAMEELGITAVEFEALREGALATFATDLTTFLENPGRHYGYGGNLDLAWGRARNPNVGDQLWKVVAIFADQDNPSQDFYYPTLDQMLAGIYGFMHDSDNVDILTSGEADPNILDDDERLALTGIQNSLEANPDNIWSILEEGKITLSVDFQLAIYALTKGAQVHVVGDHLYIYVGEEDEGSYYEYYTKEDGLLILTSFFLQSNTWDVEMGSPYLTTVPMGTIETEEDEEEEINLIPRIVIAGPR